VTKTLDRQVVVRIPADLHAALQADAEENGRTLAQTVRFHLGRALNNGRCAEAE